MLPHTARLREPQRQVGNLVKTKVDSEFNFQASEWHTEMLCSLLVARFTLIAFDSNLFMGVISDCG